MEKLLDYIRHDNRINLKLGVVIVGCFALSYIVTLTYAGGFWISGLLNTIALAAFGFSGVVAIVRNEVTPFMRAPFLPPKIVGIITAVIGFGLALAMLGLTLLYAMGGSL